MGELDWHTQEHGGRREKDGIHCDDCGYMDCECIVQVYRCPKCMCPKFLAITTNKTCHCGQYMELLRPEFAWVICKTTNIPVFDE